MLETPLEEKKVYAILVDRDGIKVVEEYSFDGNKPGIPLSEFLIRPVKINASILENREPLTKDCCRTLTSSSRSHSIVASDLTIGGEIECTASEFGELLEVFGITRIDSSYPIPQDFFDNDVLKMQCNRLFLNSCGLTDSQLLEMKFCSFHVKSENISDSGINLFLKQ